MGHTLSRLESSPYPSGGFLCNLCREEGCGPVYHCSDCDFDVHVTCASMATPQTHFSHSFHPLHLAHCGNRRRKCNSCGLGIRSWSFRCEICDYDMHSMCVRAPRFMMHPRHPHPLALSQAADVSGPSRCDGCKMPVANLFYRCHGCHYNLHQVCATLPSKIKHLKHQAHMLTLMNHPSQDGLFALCHECGEQVKGWRFNCVSCNFNLHPGCTNLAHELPHFNVGVNSSHERSNATPSRSASVGVNSSHERSNATPSRSASVGCTISHNHMVNSAHERSNATISTSASVDTALIWRSVTHTPFPSNTDWEAVERVLRFAQEMAKGSASYGAQGISLSHEDNNEDRCPTCLEAFDSTNPKKSTSCGHYFHLACILEWMERSTNCPVCRRYLEISM